MKTVVIKIGGRPASDTAAVEALCRELKALEGVYRFAIVHGGGAEVTRITEALLQRKPSFVDGIRMTPPEEMVLVDMVLAGKVNKELVRRLEAAGVAAWGVSGADAGILKGDAVAPGNRTARIRQAKAAPLELLLDAGYTPVAAPVASDGRGGGLNINADEAALGIATALKAEALLFLSDIPGIMKENRVITTVTPGAAQAEIRAGVIQGGMIPKVESSLRSLEAGVGAVIIGAYTGEGDLAALLAHQSGTLIVNENNQTTEGE